MSNTFDIKDDEQLDILQGSLSILQKKDGFRYGTDAILLADFAKKTAQGRLMDLCSGTAIVPLLLSRYKKITEMSAIEIQPEIADMAMRSIKGNILEDKIRLICDDLKNVKELYKQKSFDCVTCNPPYMKVGTAVVNETDTKVISRHEVCCSLEDVITNSRYLLKDFGRLYLVHKPNRLAEIIHTMCRYKIEPKRMRLVHSRTGKEPSLVLIEGLVTGGSEMRIEPPLYLYNDDGTFTDEVNKIYNSEV